MRASLLERDSGRVFDCDVLRGFGKFGLFDAHVPLAEKVRRLFLIGHHGLDIPMGVALVAQLVAAEALSTFGSSDLLCDVSKRVASAESIAAIANSEVGAGTSLRSMQASASFNGESYRVVANKRGITNVPSADVALISAWIDRGNSHRDLEVFLATREQMQQQSDSMELSGFFTGATGTISVNDTFGIATLLGSAPRAGFTILKSCFDSERILIGALVAGALKGLLDEVLRHLQQRERTSTPLAQHQYVQEKVVGLALAQTTLSALVDSTVADSSAAKLAAIKIAICEDSSAAALRAVEVFGYDGYRANQIPQKVLRDLMALKILGGTQEQSKITFFEELFEKHNQAELKNE